ncbi:MAG: hypothetical protein GY847_35700 [Proteobacteria bacterium]|nr:hypothetical protein [Pseudomonadota bacterium]
MKKPASTINNEQGSLPVIGIAILVLLTFIGISATRTSDIEVRIASNDRHQKMAFYATDAGVEAGIELLEWNIEERGFDFDENADGEMITGEHNEIEIAAPEFYVNDTVRIIDLATDTPTELNGEIINKDITISDIGENDVHLRMYGTSQLSDGSAIALASAYDGTGFAAGSGGGKIIFEIRSFGTGNSKSRARIRAGWIHVIKTN